MIDFTLTILQLLLIYDYHKYAEGFICCTGLFVCAPVEFGMQSFATGALIPVQYDVFFFCVYYVNRAYILFNDIILTIRAERGVVINVRVGIIHVRPAWTYEYNNICHAQKSSSAALD